MAELVWRYTAQDPSTSHLVYAAPETPADRDPGLAAVSICRLADVGSGRKWRGGTPAQARHMAKARQCGRCATWDEPALVAS